MSDLADPGSFTPVDEGLETSDPLGWPEYPAARAAARERSGAPESVRAGSATIGGTEVELALFEFGYLGGSMGEVAGETLARAMERAAGRGKPFVLRTSTGGARMQEGMVALVQMPKTVLARRALARAHVPFIAVLGHPTTGGVFASLGSLADVTVAEAEATIGFAGPRVAASFTGDDVEGHSHSAATAYAHGLVDDVVPASEIHPYVSRALDVLAPDAPLEAQEPASVADGPHAPDPWDLVNAVRADSHPSGEAIIRTLGDPLLELRGDRAGEDDPAALAAIVRLRGRRVLVLALERAHAPGSAAYRKARRCIAVAERLELPVVTLIDTRGADPSSSSENAGIAGQIALTFDALLHARVATISVVTGEGGSGGALAFACTDRLLAAETSIFSVIGPEGAAQILWRDPDRAPEAARVLRLGSADLVRLGIADGLVPDGPEPLVEALAYHLDRLASTSPEELLTARHDRWRRRV